MNQLTVGQRIDVYEVVDILTDSWGDAHIYTLGSHVAGRYKRNCEGQDTYEYELFNSTMMFYKELARCGYYLKVKSLKGGNNE